MPRHLVVAYQTAGGTPLRDVMREIARTDSNAEFVLLVPATRTQHLFSWTEGESLALARERANEAARQLADEGLDLGNTVVGDADPFLAVTALLDSDPGFGSIILSTFPPGVSRWLRLDLPTRLEKATGVPVRHVVVAPDEAGADRS